MDREVTILPEELERLGLDAEEFRLAARIELTRRRKADQYLHNPFLFYKYVCTAPDKRHNLGKLHKDGLAWVNDGAHKRRLILWPRGHLKTTTFTQSEMVRKALLDPDVRILISSAKWDNAKRILLGIKGILATEQFIELYGDLLPKTTSAKTYKNNDSELTLMNRVNMRLNQATFTTTGIDKEMTSQHYDFIVHDDLVARDNVGTTEMMDKVIQYYRDCVSLLDPKKEMWIIGTRWHPLDLYGFLIDGAADPRCKQHHLVKHVDNCKCKIGMSIRQLKEEGEYIFPEIFDDEYMDILIEQDQLDRYSVASQYYNNPTDPSTCWFRPSDIEASLIDASEVYHKPDGTARNLVWYTAIDPAESTQSRACKTAAVSVGIDQETGDWYVDGADGRRVETPGFLQLCIEVYRRYRPAKFGMELNTRKSLAYSLKEYMLKVGTIFNIEELKPQRVGDAQRTKDQRIKRLLPLFEFKKIHINRELKDLLDELYTIPAATSIDLTDALSYILDLVPPGMGYNKTVGPQGEIRLPRRKIGWPGMGY
jgi:hypothetical protein